ncbi:hypothetical protein [Caulobacter sp. NIBR1757]|uniref:hypothetical protein n=1 Tax=Caulobacter sp. NIBR1757 TaxID=3016000 RepID=UPI0022F0B54B|nr:hypothetical protein [Caulobacter sp. NIBR1757]WGM38450.1 hypothetical protein AMEJIAPC_01353 [Caulobacter sp. NIBR1757]
MTKDQIQSVRDDIAFMRALAEEGTQVPLLGGGVTLAAGIIFAAASVVHWAITEQVLRVPDWALMINWLGFGALFGVICHLLVKRVTTQPGANSSVNKATGSAWSAVGFAIFTMFLALFAMAWVTKNGAIFNVFPVLILALYGSAWSVAADLSGKTWIRLVALGSFASAVVMGLLAASPYLMLGYAAALLLLAALPGFILLRQEPSDTI